MTRSQKSTLYWALYWIVTTLMFVLVMWLMSVYREQHQTKTVLTISMLYIGGLLALSSWLNRHKKPIVLTEEERQRPLEPFADFSNSFD